MYNRIVHIGFPKTATTFLQWHIFPYLEGVAYVDYHTCRKVFQPIIYADPIDYSISDLESTITQEKGTSLYSFESLAGSPYYYKGIGRSSIPNTLKSMGFHKVIITIRDQVKALDSYYRQYVVQGGTLNFKNWLDLDDRRPIPQKYFQKGYLHYDKLISKYVEVFGKENVLILTQEFLKKDQEGFIGCIERFSKSTFKQVSKKKKANESLSNLSVTLLRFFNHFTFSSVRPFHLFSKKISNRPIWKLFAVLLDPYFIRFISGRKSYVEKYKLTERLREFYGESNESLREKWGIDFNEINQ